MKNLLKVFFITSLVMVFILTGCSSPNVGQADGAAVGAPTLASKTQTAITINPVAAPDNGQTVEYAISDANTAPSSGWQDELYFNSLTPNTSYYIFARAKANIAYNTGAPSAGLTVTTDAEVSNIIQTNEDLIALINEIINNTEGNVTLDLSEYEFTDGVFVFPEDIEIPSDLINEIVLPDTVTEFDIPAEVLKDIKRIRGAGITVIDENTFKDCTNLEEIDFPALTIIGDNAFSGCTNLKTVTIPDSVTTIGNNAFSGCTSLENVTIPDGVIIIGDNAFSGCINLESIIIPDSVTTIGDYAFSGCTSLENIIISNNVKIIGNNAFSGCTSLESVTIPGNVTTIGDNAFSDCTSLESVTFESDDITFSINSPFPGDLQEKYLIGKSGTYTRNLDSGANDVWYLETGFPITSANIKGFIAPVGGVVPMAVGSLSTEDQEYSIISIVWSPAITNNTFAYNQVYTAAVTLAANTGYVFNTVFTPTVDVDTGTPVAGTVNGTGTGNTFKFTVTFTATGLAPITSATIAGIVAPVGEAVPVTATNLSTDDPGYNITHIEWSPTATGKFVYNKEYSAEITLTSNQGYMFNERFTPTVNIGTPTTGIVNGTGAGNTFKFTVSFPTTGPIPITSANITGITAPVGGVAPMTYASLTITDTDPGYNITSIAWSPSITNNTFAYDTVYTATITLTSKSDYTFNTGFKPTVNTGTAAEGDVTGSGNTLTFTVTFPETVVKFVAVGYEGRMAYSANSIDWELITFGPTSNSYEWSSVTYGNGKWVAGGYGIAHSTNGIDWYDSNVLPISDFWYDIKYGNGKWVAVGHSGNIMHSINGIDWFSIVKLSGVNTLYKVEYGNGRWVAVGASNSSRTIGVIANSTDGENWTTITQEGGFVPQGVAYNNSLWIIVGRGGTNGSIMVSNNGINWGFILQKVDNELQSITYGNGMWITAGLNSILQSTDGYDWKTTYSLDSTQRTMFTGVVYGNNRWITVSTLFSGGATRGPTAYSTDGIEWSTYEPNPFNGRMNDVAYRGD